MHPPEQTHSCPNPWYANRIEHAHRSGGAARFLGCIYGIASSSSFFLPSFLSFFCYTHSYHFIHSLHQFSIPLLYTTCTHTVSSFSMASQEQNPRFYQDISSYKPRHANIAIDDYDQMTIPHSLPQRPRNFNTYGKDVNITLNTFNVVKTPGTIVHQYDLHFTGDAQDYTKRVLLKKIFHSKGVKQALGEPSNLWVWDGNKLAW